MTAKEAAVQVISTLQGSGFDAVLAGGCVRDELMGFEPHDFDVATSCDPDTVESLFDKTIPVGKQFGVVRVLIDGIETEVATFRNDSKESDGRRPDSVVFSSMEEDAKRRDLSGNGLFLEIPATELPPLSSKELDILFWNIFVLLKRGIKDPHVTQDATSTIVELLPSEIPALIKKKL